MAAAVIKKDDLYLCARRKENKYKYLSKKFEFPGGKVESGETLQEALVREIYEELGVKVCINNELKKVQHEYPDFKVEITFFSCNFVGNYQYVNFDHEEIIWLPAAELALLDWAAADLPIVDLLQQI
ncbi:(deoxy)nucleoside triphosphate pyrophosphohydrolase [Acinetobacter baumannii]|uniref:(deoxy)nucleoside triphosphate pyrophosphohydrolase n=1 Tax=Acinetobacter calcoaceticus/baumannii complex TaxID=909768 RepID=UPI000313A2AB|nr:(deoxy)nucleoside triphosphate pyrophosphohydrolase [Acinetobacter calcoaceticus]MDV7588913.1 (deoxy)nucleoside triphosphate pyrophosphohydrolase [Acinetobacter baumannii]MDV7595749.1 (deoxy)nucleoside triphosphate pyrophosphohydrolase [Acinetobacter baumannii]UGQ26106.1 (deoxy)nucleoside triphosphate pyrophosphohydrolase [Acinetobacter calcoaceticus]